MIELSIDDVLDFDVCPVKYLMNKRGDVTYRHEKREDQFLFDGVKNRYYLDLLEGKTPGVDDITNNLSRLIYNMGSYNLLDPKRINRERERKVIKLVSTFAQHETKLSQSILAVEQPFVLNFSNGLLIKDHLPLVRMVEGQLELVDFVVSNKKIGPFYADTSIRLTFYDMAFRQMYDRKPDRIAIYHVPSKSIFHTDRNVWQYERMKKKVDYIQHSISTESYHTRETFMCDTCNARFSCIEYYK